MFKGIIERMILNKRNFRACLQLQISFGLGPGSGLGWVRA